MSQDENVIEFEFIDNDCLFEAVGLGNLSEIGRTTFRKIEERTMMPPPSFLPCQINAVVVRKPAGVKYQFAAFTGGTKVARVSESDIFSGAQDNTVHESIEKSCCFTARALGGKCNCGGW